LAFELGDKGQDIINYLFDIQSQSPGKLNAMKDEPKVEMMKEIEVNQELTPKEQNLENITNEDDNISEPGNEEQDVEKSDNGPESKKFDEIVESSAFKRIEEKGIREEKIIYFFEPEIVWKLFEPEKNELEWKEFRKRCNSSTSKNIVYLEKEFRTRTLNVSPNLLRGVKRWLTDETHKRVMKEEFISMLYHFTPIVCVSSRRYLRFTPSSGFTIPLIFKTLSLPSFVGTLSATKIEEILKNSYTGDHRIRFSTADPLSFTLQYKTSKEEIKSLRLIRNKEKGKSNYF